MRSFMEKWCFILCALLFVLPFVSGIGLSPDYLYLPYAPLAEGTTSMRVINTVESPLLASLYLEGELAEYFTIVDTSVPIGPLSSEPFTITYKLPYEHPTPGPNQIIVHVKNEPPGGGVAAVLNVIAKIIVEVPYPEKYLAYTVTTQNVNVGENILFNFAAHNKGSENIFTVKPSVTFYHTPAMEESLGTYEGQPVSLVVNNQKTISLAINSTELGTGEYFVVTSINYDGIPTPRKDISVTVGYKDISVINYTEMLLAGSIQEFSLTLKNHWNRVVEDVYVEAYLARDSVPLTNRFFSQTKNINPLETFTLPLFLDVTDIAAGSYDVIVNVYYDDLTKQETLSLKLRDNLYFSTEIFIAFLIVLLIIADIFWMSFARKKSTKRNSEEKMKKLFGK